MDLADDRPALAGHRSSEGWEEEEEERGTGKGETRNERGSESGMIRGEGEGYIGCIGSECSIFSGLGRPEDGARPTGRFDKGGLLAAVTSPSRSATRYAPPSFDSTIVTIHL